MPVTVGWLQCELQARARCSEKGLVLGIKLTAPHDTVAVAPAKAGLHAGNSLRRHSLEDADVEAELVPLDGRALNPGVREGDLGLPVLRRALGNQIDQSVANPRVRA